MEDGNLHVWTLRGPRPGSEPPDALGVLDERERGRAAAFVNPQDRQLYVAAHLALRRILAERLGIAPAEVRFGRDPCPCCDAPHGRPVVLGAPAPPHFSLSHSRGAALIAVAAVPVGVDVQRLASTETVELCLGKLHVREQRELAALSDAELPAAFSRLWTRKEAYLKGLGTGLGRSLAADYLGGSERGQPRGWLVRNLPSDPGYACAVALRSGAGGHRAELLVRAGAAHEELKGNGERHAEYRVIARSDRPPDGIERTEGADPHRS